MLRTALSSLIASTICSTVLAQAPTPSIRLTWTVADQTSEKVIPLPAPSSSAQGGSMQVKGEPATGGDCSDLDTSQLRNALDDGFAMELRAGPASERGAALSVQATFARYLGTQSVLREGRACEVRLGAGRRESTGGAAFLRYGEPTDLILARSDASIGRVTAALLKDPR